MRFVADFGDHPRAGNIDLVHGFHGRGPGRQHIDLVGEADRFLEVVGDEHDGRLGCRPQPEQFLVHQHAGLHVEGREGLVHQQDVGTVDEGLRQGDPLAHAARKLVRIVAFEGRKADPSDPIAGAGIGFGLGFAPKQGAGRHVVQDIAPGEEGVGLEHEADARVDARDRLADDPDLAARRPAKSGDQVERRRLAAAGGPDKGHELAAAHGEVEVAQRREALAVGAQETAADVGELDGRDLIGVGHRQLLPRVAPLWR